MVIVFVVPSFLAKNTVATGLPNYIYRVSKSLQKLGHTPIVITAGGTDENVRYDGIHVYRRRIPKCLLPGNEIAQYLHKSLFMNMVLGEELNNLCKKQKVDIIQFCNLYGIGSFYRGKIPSVLRLSSYAPEYYKYSDTYSHRYIKTMGLVERLAGKGKHAIFAPSNVMASAYCKDTGRHVDVIETPFIIDTCGNNELYQMHLAGKKYFLFFGSLYAEKGIYVISKIVGRLLIEHPDFYFVFIGPLHKNDKTPLKEIYKNAGNCKDRVIYLKPLKHDSLYPIIQHAQYVVLPSLMDNFPNACIEAMSFGRIVIGTDGTSFEQLITDGVNGFLSKPGDAESLYRKICEACALTTEQKSTMSEKAAQRIDLLKPNVVVKRLIQYYGNVISDYQRKSNGANQSE